MAKIEVVEFVRDCGFAQEGDTAYVEGEEPGQLYVRNKQLNRRAWVDRECVKHHDYIEVNTYQKPLWKGPL